LGGLVHGVSRLRWVVALGLALAALLHTRASSPPLYDGLPLPQAPYNYCTPPANLKSSNKPPSGGQAAFPIQTGRVAGGGVQTGDAQVVVFIGLDSLQASPGTTSVLVSVEPVCDAPPPPPPGAELRANVYRINAVEQPSGGQVTVTSSYHLTMRYPPGGFKELQFYDGTAWHPVKTTLAPSGNPYAGAVLNAFGEVAATAAPGQGGDSILTVAARYLEGFGILALVILFGIIAVVQEVRRRRRKT
jgi:hypothetical protein